MWHCVLLLHTVTFSFAIIYLICYAEPNLNFKSKSLISCMQQHYTFKGTILNRSVCSAIPHVVVEFLNFKSVRVWEIKLISRTFMQQLRLRKFCENNFCES